MSDPHSSANRLLRELFSDSSSDDGFSQSPCTASRPVLSGPICPNAAFGNDSPCHVSKVTDVPGVPGLRLFKGWLGNAQQEALQSRILASGALQGMSNQAMFFGSLPDWASLVTSLLPSDLLPPHLASRVPLFNQIILNRYLPGEGITDHVDLARFQDGIISVSLGGPAIMHFTPLQGSGTPAESIGQFDGQCSSMPPMDSVQVLLEGGDLLVLSGPARYDWKHGIRSVTQEVHEPSGRVVTRGVRISITLRRLCDDIVLTEPAPQ